MVTGTIDSRSLEWRVASIRELFPLAPKTPFYLRDRSGSLTPRRQHAHPQRGLLCAPPHPPIRHPRHLQLRRAQAIPPARRAAPGVLGRIHPPPGPAATARSRPAERPQQPDHPDSYARAISGHVLFLQRPGPRPPRLSILPADVPARPHARLQVPGLSCTWVLPTSCPRRQYFIRGTRFPYLEVDRLSHSHYIRADLPSHAWFHPGLLRAVLADERPAPQAPPQPSVALLQHHPGAADAAPLAPAIADPRPTTQPPAGAPAPHRAVFCAASPAPSSPPAPPAICNHTRLGAPPRTPTTPTHTRAWATVDGVRCEVIIDRGADLSLISADVLKPHRSYQPWAPASDCVTGVNNHTLQVLGRVALEIRVGPLKTTAPFFVVPGVAFAALLGVDFLYEHEIAVSLARHARFSRARAARPFRS
ncbi:hypothetical protein Emag_007211 [Eimeria magna]